MKAFFQWLFSLFTPKAPTPIPVSPAPVVIIKNNVNPAGMRLIKSFEGCNLNAYLDTSTPPVVTIGWGRTTHGIKMGDTCTQEQADAWLLEDVQAEGSHFIDAWVKVPLSSDQYSALSSFIYNCGAGTFKRGQVFAKLSAADYRGAADAFLLYDRAGGDPLPGLSRRRRAERFLFLGDLVKMQEEVDS